MLECTRSPRERRPAPHHEGLSPSHSLPGLRPQPEMMPGAKHEELTSFSEEKVGHLPTSTADRRTPTRPRRQAGNRQGADARILQSTERLAPAERSATRAAPGAQPGKPTLGFLNEDRRGTHAPTPAPSEPGGERSFAGRPRRSPPTERGGPGSAGNWGLRSHRGR